MTEAKRDNNQVPTILATSSSDGITPEPVCADPTSDNAICAEDGTSGSDLSGDNAARDENSVPVLMAVSSADGVTPVPVYINPATKKLLIKST